MKEIWVDFGIVGGGPAGLAAALEAKKQGIGRVMILERDFELGGILPQCIHDGFGLHRFGKRLSGPQYAQRFINEVQNTDIDVRLNTMVLEITSEKTIFACNKEDGILKIHCGAVLLAMGCRERTASQILLYGSRPSGVMTAGSAQRYINMEGYLPGKRAVILGSGDIGLIMARRMKLEGIDVLGVYEVMPSPGGLTRNIVQCLDDYAIPLHLSHTVSCVHGKHALEGITVMQVDRERNPIPGTEQFVACDLLVLAVGLIPENELSLQAGIQLDACTKGPLLDNHFMTSIPGIFAAGNVSVVFDLVDYVSQSGEIAARNAAKYLAGKLEKQPEYLPVTHKGNIHFVVPQRLCKHAQEEPEEAVFFLRVKEPAKQARLQCKLGAQVLEQKVYPSVAPPEMLACKIRLRHADEIQLEVEGQA